MYVDFPKPAILRTSLTHRQILRVSIYYESRDLPQSPEVHGRVTLYNGSMELSDLLEMEMEGEYGQTGNKRERGEMLVTGKPPAIPTTSRN